MNSLDLGRISQLIELCGVLQIKSYVLLLIMNCILVLYHVIIMDRDWIQPNYDLQHLVTHFAVHGFDHKICQLRAAIILQMKTATICWAIQNVEISHHRLQAKGKVLDCTCSRKLVHIVHN